MKIVYLFVSLFAFLPVAFGSQASVQSIQNGISITRVELEAIHSGRYTSYRPETIRSVLSNLSSAVDAAINTSDSRNGQEALRDLKRSIAEEYSYSFNFQVYRLASTELLMLNYQRLFRLALDGESAGNIGGDGGNSWGCTVGRVACF